MSVLNDIKRRGKRAVFYGAPAKGSVFIHQMGIDSSFVEFAVDINTEKQGLYIPGTDIPVYHPRKLKESKPDYVIILPWNIEQEIASDHRYIEDWGGKFIVFSPEFRELG